MQVVVNDEPRELTEGATVADLVAALGLGARRIAVEVNRAVVPRAEYAATVLRQGDAVGAGAGPRTRLDRRCDGHHVEKTDRPGGRRANLG